MRMNEDEIVTCVEHWILAFAVIFHSMELRRVRTLTLDNLVLMMSMRRYVYMME
jgi:hypothetical protein